MEFAVRHETTYQYPSSVAESFTVVHLQPRTNLRQYCTHYELSVAPATRIFSYVDRFGNDVQHFSVIPDHRELRIVAQSRVVTIAGGPSEIPARVDAAALETDPALAELDEFRTDSPYVTVDDAVRSVANAIAAPRGDLAAYFMAAGKYVHDRFTYHPGLTTVQTTVGETLESLAGVCQDFAHVLVALGRARGIPTRYASGYIHLGGAGVLGADASHAWAEAYLPPYGWVGFDPTNDRVVDDTFVLVALGRDYGDVSPTRGLYRGRKGSLSVSVAVAGTSDQ
ncbi:MAG: transglutaminase domain-containing protein [Candidatus Velthaea sp.]